MVLSTTTFAQKQVYTFHSLSDSLKINANSVIRNEQIDITILSNHKMNIKSLRVITVLNELGKRSIDAELNYDKSTILKNVEAVIYDPWGKEIKKIKQKDFTDVSAADGSTLFSDNRFLYLDYTPISYPFTVAFSHEIETSSTAFIPQWFPVDNYYSSIEKSAVNVVYPVELGFRKMEFNFENYPIQKTQDSEGRLSYVISNFPAVKYETHSPSALSYFPRVMMSLSKFHLEGVDGEASTWAEFGKWYSEKILEGTTELPKETVIAIKKLVGEQKDPIEKAKIVYDFVQQKSRYVSIQVGIGGWKPMFAKDVDRLGYGDCKALSNYTRALLKEVGVESYNTLLYGDSEKISFERDFVSMQGNHMILAIPNNNRYIWLECTSQDDPFGYQGTFTDDRDVLVVKPSGAEIVRTQIYPDKDNSQVSVSTYEISEKGSITGKTVIESKGSQYARKMKLEKFIPVETERFYKNYWSNIPNLQLLKTKFENDKKQIKTTETIEIVGDGYAKFSSNSLIFVANAFNMYQENVRRIRGRKMPFEIDRGFVDIDETKIKIPAGFTVEFLPPAVELKSKFGTYNFEIIKKDDSTLIYKRSLSINRGLHPKEEFENYRQFVDDITRNDNAKIILTK